MGQRRMQQKPHLFLQRESFSQVGFLPFHKMSRQTLQPTLMGLLDPFWKLCNPKFIIHQDPSSEIAPTAMQLSSLNGND